MLTTAIQEQLGAVRGMAHCTNPNHKDRTRSLSIRAGADGRTLIKCFAGCDLRDVLKGAGLTWADLFDGLEPTPEAKAAWRDRRELEDAERRIEAAIRMQILFPGHKAHWDREEDKARVIYAETLKRTDSAEFKRRESRKAHARCCDLVCKLQRVASGLGEKLMNLPDDSPNTGGITTLFHEIQNRIRRAEAREVELRP